MDRNNMRSSYLSNSGPRSLPHLGGGKRHNGAGHGHAHLHAHTHTHAHAHAHAHNARLSPPAPAPPQHAHGNNAPHTQHDDLINYIYDSWNKVSRELERGSEDARYYQEVVAPRALANFRPFNLEEWWARRLLQTINRNKHRS